MKAQKLKNGGSAQRLFYSHKYKCKNMCFLFGLTGYMPITPCNERHYKGIKASSDSSIQVAMQQKINYFIKSRNYFHFKSLSIWIINYRPYSCLVVLYFKPWYVQSDPWGDDDDDAHSGGGGPLPLCDYGIK